MKNQKINTKVIVRIVFTLLLALPMSLLSQDSNKTPRISFGFNSGYMNSFTNNILNSGSSNDILITYTINPTIAINLGYNTCAYTKELSNMNHSVLHSGLLLGMDYFLKSNHDMLSSSVNLSLVNSFDSFDSFKNSHVDLLYRLNFYKTFYLGLGVNYTHNSISAFSADPFNNANLILQIGVRGIGFKFGRK